MFLAASKHAEIGQPSFLQDFMTASYRETLHFFNLLDFPGDSERLVALSLSVCSGLIALQSLLG